LAAERTLVLVNYFTANLLGSAIASARGSSSTPLRVVVVDNSGDPAESALLRPLPIDEVIDAPENPGYGAGANLGARNAEGIIIVANPDVEFFPGCIDRLAGEVSREGVVAAGPKFVWDREGEWLLPPPDLPTLGGALDRLAAGRSGWWAERWLARRQRARGRFWLRQHSADERVLSGAVLCLRAEAFHAIGGFDPEYRLYFEEIDLLERLRRGGGRIRYVPEAVCRHLYNQSAGRSGSEAGALYARAERRYYERHFGSWLGKALLDWRRPLRLGVPEETGSFDVTVAPGEGRWIVEASPLFDFSTAAGRFTGSEEIRIPSEIVETLRSSELYVRVVERSSGRPARSLRLHRGGAPLE
jgi:N-acetylglucosaminyl-diphospho-decaprenol L-rhamnosyltransferase